MEDAINSLYNKETYLDKYGGSLVITIITIIIAFLIYAYFAVSHNINGLRANWNENKCKPTVIPFAGLINAKDGESKMEFTQKNFVECTQTILTLISGEFLEPIYYSTQVTGKIFGELANDINNIRKIFSRLRDNMSEFIDSVLSKFLYAIMPIRRDIIKLKATLGKTHGVLTGAIFTSLASYMGLRAFFGAFIEIVIKGLIALAAFIVAMWILPFTWPVAGAATAFFVAITVPFAIAIAYLKTIVHTSNSKIPKKPKKRCFDGDTQIITVSGEKKIKDLVPGDELDLGNFVIGTLKCSTDEINMYYLDGVIVSEHHQYQKEDGSYDIISYHPDSIKIDDWRGDALYCLNTSKKYFYINDVKYLDWDEITQNELNKIKQQLIDTTDFGRNLTFNNFNRYLDGGFIANTNIKMKNGTYKFLSDVLINDELYNGEKVLGIIKMKTYDIYMYDIYGNIIYGGPNLIYSNDGIQLQTTINNGKLINKEELINNNINCDYFYHLITNTDTFNVNDILFFDYNYCVDSFLL